jgi:hypothetical protein
VYDGSALFNLYPALQTTALATPVKTYPIKLESILGVIPVYVQAVLYGGPTQYVSSQTKSLFKSPLH